MQGRRRKGLPSRRRVAVVKGPKTPRKQLDFAFPTARTTREWIHSKLLFESRRTHGETSRIRALVEQSPVGQMWYTPERIKNRMIWKVDIDIPHENRRKGIATQLIRELIETAEKARVNALRVYVDNGDPSTVGFLQKIGFQYKFDNQATRHGEKPIMVYEYAL